MLLDAIIIVLRETLEAGILFSLFLTIARRFQINFSWLWNALIIGFAFAWLYASNIRQISVMFDYAGQEVLNAIAQLIVYLSLLVLAYFISTNQTGRSKSLLIAAMMSALSMAVLREGAEIFIFLSGLLENNSEVVVVKALTSGFIGLMIGASVGALCYYAIIAISDSKQKIVQIIMLVLLGAGMISQAVRQFVQVDWLPSTAEAWSTELLLPEESTFGQLAYAVFSYEATPSLLEAGSHLAAIILICICILVGFKYKVDQGR